jgi:predicted  nucleic acid-binding Zn-ribbon protein
MKIKSNNMKHNLIIICASVITLGTFFTGCRQDTAEKDRLRAERDSLLIISGQRDSIIDVFVESFAEIQMNLDSMKTRQEIISVSAATSPEKRQSQRERINEDIRLINNLLDENRNRIADLEKQLKSSNYKSSQFQKLITSLRQQLAQKENELLELKEELAGLNLTVENLNVSIDTLRSVSRTQTRLIDAQSDKLNTAFYTVGTAKELEKKGVIDREGGFLGIGKEEKLRRDFENDNFNRIGIYETMTIPVDHRRVKFVTSHPSDSYTLEKNGDKIASIQITDPEKFWRASKYLVVVKD